MSIVKEVKERYENYLMRIEGVVGVGMGDNEIIIYIESRDPKLLAFLPRELENIPIRLIETGGKIVPME